MPAREPESARAENRLARESSLYLRQHARNPVAWWPWGAAALAAARAANKPLLVSIGYSACHWCHVMERESFEDAATAALMNQHFICIKVDREERPDVDQLYMETVLRISGHGGWPLTVFCKPDGAPFHAGTYYPPEPRHGLPSFRQVLHAMQRAFCEQRSEVDAVAARLLEALAAPHSLADGGGASESAPAPALLTRAARDMLAGADRQHGGFGGAPKFPMPATLELLLAACDHADAGFAREALAHLRFSLSQMARRGLYDALGGGFHRYCTDAHWGVPHFEKMLYDQGQLLRVYADVFRRCGFTHADLLWPIHETANWLRHEMLGPEGGWCASQDADSEGTEGAFYVWTPAQVEAVLGPERAREFCEAYAVTARGNFEGKCVLWKQTPAAHESFARERAALYHARARREAPATDTKRVLGWNALTISGLAYAGSVLPDAKLLDDAVRAAQFVEAHLRRREAAGTGNWWRVFAEGRAQVGAFLDDLAAWLAACLDLHRAGAGAAWLARAQEIAREIDARFFDAAAGDFFLAPAHDATLPVRPRAGHDGALPDARGHAVLGLLRVAALTGDARAQSCAERVLQAQAPAIARAPRAFPTLLRAAALAHTGISVAVIVGETDAPNTQALALAARRALAPEHAVVVAAPGEAPAALDPTWLQGREAAAQNDAATRVASAAPSSRAEGAAPDAATAQSAGAAHSSRDEAAARNSAAARAAGAVSSSRDENVTREDASVRADSAAASARAWVCCGRHCTLPTSDPRVLAELCAPDALAAGNNARA